MKGGEETKTWKSELCGQACTIVSRKTNFRLGFPQLSVACSRGERRTKRGARELLESRKRKGKKWERISAFRDNDAEKET